MDGIFNFLREQLSNHLQLTFGTENADVGYLRDGSSDPIDFVGDQLTLLMVKLEEEKTMRPADRYQKMATNGSLVKAQPELRLNLYLLIVAQYQVYTEALRRITAAVRFFQGHNFFQRQSFPELPEDVEQLSLELATQSFSEQNELWSTLKAAYRPCALYKIKMLLIEQEEPSLTGDIQEKTIRLSGL